MNIQLKNIGKKFIHEWIFRKIDLSLEENTSYAITGPNGSGKSTFLQILSGYLLPTTGKIEYFSKGKNVAAEKAYGYISITGPYLELPEEMTLKELYNFHTGFRSLQCRDFKDFSDFLMLSSEVKKPLKNYSSGMKQRVKLGVAILSEAPVLLLDEPSTNLDKSGIEWYRKILLKEKKNRLIVISSNQSHEYDFTEKEIRIIDFKKGSF